MCGGDRDGEENAAAGAGLGTRVPHCFWRFQQIKLYLFSFPGLQRRVKASTTKTLGRGCKGKEPRAQVDKWDGLATKCKDSTLPPPPPLVRILAREKEPIKLRFESEINFSRLILGRPWAAFSRGAPEAPPPPRPPARGARRSAAPRVSSAGRSPVVPGGLESRSAEVSDPGW